VGAHAEIKPGYDACLAEVISTEVEARPAVQQVRAVTARELINPALCHASIEANEHASFGRYNAIQGLVGSASRLPCSPERQPLFPTQKSQVLV
jgi:hypothetical protein